jgi:hypothetical protein
MSTSFLKLLGISILTIGSIAVVPMALSSDEKSPDPSSSDLAKVLDHYWLIEQLMSRESIAGVTEKAESMIPAARSLGDKKLSKEIVLEAKRLAENAGNTAGHSLEQARQNFKNLSATLTEYLRKHPQADWQLFRCREAKTKWVQKKDTPMKNPFESNTSPACGEKI